MSLKRTDDENARRLALLDEAIVEGVSDQKRELLVDFDAAYDELVASGPAPVFRLGGVDYPFPPAMPAQFYVYLTRNCVSEIEGGFDIRIPDGDAALVLIEKAMGAEFARAVMRSDKPINMIVEKLFEHISERWLGMVYKKKAEANQPTPQTTTRG
jgi:hypothetical protein